METFEDKVRLYLLIFVLMANARESISSSVVENCEAGQVCVRFCCKNETICLNVDLSLVEQAKNISDDYKVIKGKPCADMYLEIEEIWSFTANGSVIVFSEPPAFLDIELYCVDYSKKRLNLHICNKDYEAVDETVKAVKNSYPYLMLISIPFLLITLLVYGWIKELRNLHGKCLMSYVWSLTILYLSLFLIRTESAVKVEWLCQNIGYVTFVAIQMCFLWLNVMCYDIWATFRRQARSSRNMSNAKHIELKRFLCYSAYAFGAPIIAAILIIAVKSSSFVAKEYKFRITPLTCWIIDSEAEFIYVYLPVGFILTFNIIFYCITAFKIFKAQKEAKAAMRHDSKRHSRSTDQNRFWLYLRLFILMGVIWSAELASWAIESTFLYIVGILNCLQGIIIFVLFVCQPKVRKMIWRAFSKSNTQTSGSSSTRGTVSSKICTSSVCFSVKKDMTGVIAKKEESLNIKEMPEIENA